MAPVDDAIEVSEANTDLLPRFELHDGRHSLSRRIEHSRKVRGAEIRTPCQPVLVERLERYSIAQDTRGTFHHEGQLSVSVPVVGRAVYEHVEAEHVHTVHGRGKLPRRRRITAPYVFVRQIEHDGHVDSNRTRIGRYVKLCHEAGHFRVFPVPVRIDARRLRVRRRETNELIARGRTATYRDLTDICRRTRLESEETVLRVRITLRGVNDHLTRRFYVYVTIRVRARRAAQTDATVDVKRLLWGRGGDPNFRIVRDREPWRSVDTVGRIQRREQTERVRVGLEPHPENVVRISNERKICLIAGTRAIARQLNHAVIPAVERGIEHVERRFRGIRGRRRDLTHRTVAHERRRIHRERTLEMGIRIDDQITTDGQKSAPIGMLRWRKYQSIC